ncbi:hypothetical protein [Sediminicola luteus]|uniref:Uncharacterized protein n=1 Tax=Sediminicola luteus TaxID=319238 RepID=A0ABV2TXT7_9FLAO
MQSVRHIFNLLFGFTFCILLVFVVSPTLFKKTKDTKSNIPITKQLEYFSLDYVFDGKKYIQLNLGSNVVDTLTRNFYIPDGEHKRILKFLRTNNIIINGDLDQILPLSLSKNQLTAFNDIRIKNNQRRIEILVIDGYYLIGTKPSLFVTGVYYFLGGIFMLLGLAGFLLLVFGLINYFKTGELPNLPNKFEGIIYVLSGFKSKKN